jgi:thiol-disulfide isomerase/thioredoxin
MRKKLFLAVISTLIISQLTAQTPYVSSKDEKHPEVTILNGQISKYILQNDPQYTWYISNQNAYKPSDAVLAAMEAGKDKFQFLIFGGTWCEDTQFILPKFFKLQEQAGVADKNISFFGVNRAKQTLGNMSTVFKVTNVPTIIVMKDGKEVGRVVEYGKTGKWDEEIAELLK